jgi:hypothetical protein
MEYDDENLFKVPFRVTLKDETDLNSFTSSRFGIGKARKKGFTSSFSVLFTFPTNVFISFELRVGDSYE